MVALLAIGPTLTACAATDEDTEELADDGEETGEIDATTDEEAAVGTSADAIVEEGSNWCGSAEVAIYPLTALREIGSLAYWNCRGMGRVTSTLCIQRYDSNVGAYRTLTCDTGVTGAEMMTESMSRPRRVGKYRARFSRTGSGQKRFYSTSRWI